MDGAPDSGPAAGRAVFDPFDPRWASDPFPLFAELRERAPIHRNEALGFWVVLRHADCLTVLRDRRASSDNTRSVDGRPSPVPPELAEARPFLFRDPPDHTRLRGLVAKAFTPRVVESLRGRTQAIVDELLDAVLDADRVDLIESFAYPLPVRIICELLGVPVADQDRFRDWSAALARGLDPDFLLPPEVLAARDGALLQFSTYFLDLLAERRRHPGDDLLSRLVAAEDGGEVLSEAELLSTCILLLVAGHETTVNLIGGGTLALLRHPDQWDRFGTDPGVVRTGVEELVRYVSPVQLTGRILTEDVDVGGVTVGAGQFAMLLLASANHDPAQFPDPERLDVARTPNNHLGFGFGIHHCLGAPLARMEAQVALATLTRRAPRLALETDDVPYGGTVVLRGPAALPVRCSG